jgi:hypothetical protein
MPQSSLANYVAQSMRQEDLDLAARILHRSLTGTAWTRTVFRNGQLEVTLLDPTDIETPKSAEPTCAT